MACPTCDHTMQNLGIKDWVKGSIFWCPRCGTLKFRRSQNFEEVESPYYIKNKRIVEVFLQEFNKDVFNHE